MYRYFNPNPLLNNHTGDCVIRGLCMLTGDDWDTVYIHIVVEGYRMKMMPSDNPVWGSYLKRAGYSRYLIPEECPVCYTLKDFCQEYDHGKFLVATGTHVIAVVDGNYYDTWDSGDETVLYYWKKET